MKLILFDIDGTLIRSHGAGRETVRDSLFDLFGTAGPIDTYHMSGKLDSRIITDLLTAAGIAQNEIQAKLPKVFELMSEKAKVTYWEKGMDACPGVEKLLEALQAYRKTAVLGLLTGNAALTAPLKLSAAGISPSQFTVGAYGSDALDRNDLPPIAMERATSLTGYTFNGKNTVIIGDTPADILCARAGKATAIAVASGWHATATLSKYQPDHLLENLTDTKYVLDMLLDE